MDTFDYKKFLTENKLTTAGRLSENTYTATDSSNGSSFTVNAPSLLAAVVGYVKGEVDDEAEYIGNWSSFANIQLLESSNTSADESASNHIHEFLRFEHPEAHMMDQDDLWDATQLHLEEYLAVQENYSNIDEYLEEIQDNGDFLGGPGGYD